jgi:hypothetical protein
VSREPALGTHAKALNSLLYLTGCLILLAGTVARSWAQPAPQAPASQPPASQAPASPAPIDLSVPLIVAPAPDQPTAKPRAEVRATANRHTVVSAPPAPEFPHAIHAATPCVTCHAAASKASAPGEAGPVPPEACAGCHADGRRPAVRSLETPWALHFSHVAHAGRGLDCAHCHAEGARADEPTCLSCHRNGQPEAGAATPYRQAPAACATCHPTAPDGRLRLEWPRGKLLPHHPQQDHGDPTWLRSAHGDAARAMPADCDTCHKPPDCSGCHLGRGRPVEIHPADYILSHPVDARRDGPTCANCHREQTFCRGCHVQSGVAMGTGPLSFGAATPGRSRFHPVGFAGSQGDVPGPEHHRHAARRSLPTCVSCHAERDCVGCHSAQAAPSLRASPHPPGVARRLCDRALGANPRGCLKCHTDPAELDRLCGP